MSLPVLIVVLGVGVLALVLTAVMLLRGSGSGPRRAKDAQGRVRAASRALAQNPRDPDALSVLGDVYFAEQNWDKAAGVYSKLLDVVASNPGLDEFTILLRHGLASMQLERFQDAYRSLMLAWKQHKNVFELNYNLGRLEVLRKRYERAEALLTEARRNRPEHIPTMRYLGQALFRVKRFNEAVGLLRRVVESEPDDAESLFFLGQAHYELGQQEHAGRLFRQLRTDSTYGPRSSLISGSIHLKNRLYDEAELDFQIGLEHDDVPPEVMLELKYRLAATCIRKQNVEKALEVLGQITQVNPAYKDVSQQIERARELAGNRNLQVYLMAPASEFVSLCRKIVSRYIAGSRSKIMDISVSRSESADVLAELHTPRWEDTVLFRFMRTSGQVGELVLRDLHTRMKDLHAGRGFCFSAGTYSEGAEAYVEARFVDLVDKEALLRLLRRV